MSPEQADPGSIDVDTRADVWALGVILYELVAGARPFERGGGGLADLEALLRAIRERDPPPPSARAAGPGAAEAAARRGLEPRGLARALRGDLDWITLDAHVARRARPRDPGSRAARRGGADLPDGARRPPARARARPPAHAHVPQQHEVPARVAWSRRRRRGALPGGAGGGPPRARAGPRPDAARAGQPRRGARAVRRARGGAPAAERSRPARASGGARRRQPGLDPPQGVALAAAGRRREAERALREAHGLLAGVLGEGHAGTRRAAGDLAEHYDRWGRPDDAAAWRARGPSAP